MGLRGRGRGYLTDRVTEGGHLKPDVSCTKRLEKLSSRSFTYEPNDDNIFGQDPFMKIKLLKKILESQIWGKVIVLKKTTITS